MFRDQNIRRAEQVSRTATMRSRLPTVGYEKASKTRGRLSIAVLAAGASLAAAALYVQWSARRAERNNPPTGKFFRINGIRLHYIDTGGPGPAVVLLHGNASMAKEWEISGIVGELAGRFRVIAFDRPGFGYSDRPGSQSWTPIAQADLLHAALRQLGIGEAIVFGHSWGTLVALELALRHAEFVKGLLLVGGFYFPVRRFDVALLSLGTFPVIGNLLNLTISPLVARALATKVIARSFAPRAVSRRFLEEFPVDLAIRPAALRAGAEDLAMMMSAAAALQSRYAAVRQPTIIIAGESDRIVDVGRQSVLLHDAIPDSELYVLPNDGHMVHYHAPLTITQALDRLAELSRAKKFALEGL
jgi:pimeloyl-ACP methyl ester carboxylesterase